MGNAVRVTDANGPLCDLHRALTGGDNSAQWDAKRCSSKDMFARVLDAPRRLAGTSLEDGIFNPASTRTCSLVSRTEGWVVVNSTHDHVHHNGVSVPDENHIVELC